MDIQTAQRLVSITSEFYEKQAQGFSATRRSAWIGWRLLTRALKDQGYLPTQLFEDTPTIRSQPQLAVLDLACGNLRFEDFLTSEVPQVSWSFHAVDNCAELLPKHHLIPFQNLDVLEDLLSGSGDPEERAQRLSSRFLTPPVDLAVTFGFMHHVPGASNREALLRALLLHTKSGGYVAASFWQFLNDAHLAQNAAMVDAKARGQLDIPPLDQGDYLLGWRHLPGVYRYCHSFAEEEIDQLSSAVSDLAIEVERFSSDGRTGNLNRYLMLQRK